MEIGTIRRSEFLLFLVGTPLFGTSSGLILFYELHYEDAMSQLPLALTNGAELPDILSRTIIAQVNKDISAIDSQSRSNCCQSTGPDEQKKDDRIICCGYEIPFLDKEELSKYSILWIGGHSAIFKNLVLQFPHNQVGTFL